MANNTVKVVDPGSWIEIAKYGWHRILGQSEQRALLRAVSASVLYSVDPDEDFIFSFDRFTVWTLRYEKTDNAHYIIEKNKFPIKRILLIENEKPWFRQWLDQLKRAKNGLTWIHVDEMIDHFSND